MKKFLELGNARTEEQRILMEQIIQDGVCPFCMEHLTKYHPKPLIRHTEHWVVTENISPYPNSRLHLMLISRVHVDIEEPWELPVGAMDETAEIIRWAIGRFNLESGALTMRFGRMAGAGASVQHLHLHLLSHDENAEGPVLFYIGNKKADS